MKLKLLQCSTSALLDALIFWEFMTVKRKLFIFLKIKKYMNTLRLFIKLDI